MDQIACLSKASALYILGDAIDYWYEYRTVVPRGFVRFFAAIASLTDAGTPVYWLKGNHDIWIFDYLPREIGVKVIDYRSTPGYSATHSISSTATSAESRAPPTAGCSAYSATPPHNGSLQPYTRDGPSDSPTDGRPTHGATAKRHPT